MEALSKDHRHGGGGTIWQDEWKPCQKTTVIGAGGTGKEGRGQGYLNIQPITSLLKTTQDFGDGHSTDFQSFF